MSDTDTETNDTLQDCATQAIDLPVVTPEYLVSQAIKHIKTIAVITDIESAAMAGAAMDMIARVEKVAHDLKTELKKKVLDWMALESIWKCGIGGEQEIVRSKKKTNRFDTQAILEILECPEELQKILPKNPAFKASEIKLNEKVCHLAWVDESEEIEVKMVNTVFQKVKAA